MFPVDVKLNTMQMPVNPARPNPWDYASVFKKSGQLIPADRLQVFLIYTRIEAVCQNQFLIYRRNG